MAKLKPNQFLLDGHIITEIPLLCQTALVQALLEDRKTQTRRTRGLDEINENPDNWNREGNPVRTLNRLWDSTKEANPNPLEILYGFKYPGWREGCDIVYQSCPYGKSGDLLWVRETFGYVDFAGEDNGYVYKATDPDWATMEGWKWKPSLFMPKAACRIWLMVEDIRVERLQDISEEDAMAEGVDITPKLYSAGNAYFDYSGKIGAQGFNFNTAKESFKTLWESINGPESWLQNPWVWVVKFRTLSKTGRPSDEAIQSAYKSITNK